MSPYETIKNEPIKLTTHEFMDFMFGYISIGVKKGAITTEKASYTMALLFDVLHGLQVNSDEGVKHLVNVAKKARANKMSDEAKKKALLEALKELLDL